MKKSQLEKKISKLYKQINILARESARYITPQTTSATRTSGEFDFIPDLLFNRNEDRENNADLFAVATEDAIGHYIVNEATMQALDDGWFFIDKKTGEQVEPLKSRQFFDFAESQEYDQYLLDVTRKARTFKWAILAYDKSQLATYSPIDGNIKDLDERNQPLTYEINPGEANAFMLDSKNTIHVLSEISYHDSFGGEGIPILWSVWSQLILLRWLEYAGTEYGARLGPGQLAIWTNGKTQDALNAIGTAFQNINSRKNIVLGKDDVDKIEQLITNTGNIAYGELTEILYGSIAAGSGHPKDAIRGAAGGTLRASEVNERSTFRVYKSIQNHANITNRNYIRIADGGKFKELLKYGIGWNKEFELSEETKAQISIADANVAQFMLTSGMFTKNQILQKMGYPARTEPEFNALATVPEQKDPGISIKWEENK